MMLMKGRNELSMNHATMNAIISAWYNTHAHMEEGKAMKCVFTGYDGNAFTFVIEEKEDED